MKARPGAARRPPPPREQRIPDLTVLAEGDLEVDLPRPQNDPDQYVFDQVVAIYLKPPWPSASATTE